MTDSRNKGARFERDIAHRLSEEFGVPLRRTPLSGGWAQDYPDAAGDIVCIDPERDWPFCIECKNAEGWRLESLFTFDNHNWFDNWWTQTIQECPDDKVPVLIFTRNYCPTFVAIDVYRYSALSWGWSHASQRFVNCVYTELRACVDGQPVFVHDLDTWIALEKALREDNIDV